MKKKKSGKRLSGSKKKALVTARKALAEKRLKAKLEAEKLAQDGPPGLEEKIVWLAEETVEPEDIIVKLGLRERIVTDPSFRGKFDELVERGQARFRAELARAVRKDALEGKVTAQRKMADAWLQRHMDQADIEFATGYRERILELIEKAQSLEHAHVRKNLKKLRKST